MFKAPELTSFLPGLVRGPGIHPCKKIQDLTTEDFIKASKSSDDLCIDLATLVTILAEKEGDLSKLVFRIDDTNVTLVCNDDHPFFVFCSGWSSLSPLLTKVKYSLSCKLLSMGDICLMVRERKKRKRTEIANLAEEIVEDLVGTGEEETVYNQPIDLSKKPLT